MRPRSFARTGRIRSSAWLASSFSVSTMSTAARCAGTGAAARLHVDRTRDEPARRRLSGARQQLRHALPAKLEGMPQESDYLTQGALKPISARWSLYVQSNTQPKITENIRGTQRRTMRRSIDSTNSIRSCRTPRNPSPWNRQPHRLRATNRSALCSRSCIRGRDARHGVRARPAHGPPPSARQLDARHVVLAATSLVAVLAIALSLTGRRAR